MIRVRTNVLQSNNIVDHYLYFTYSIDFADTDATDVNILETPIFYFFLPKLNNLYIIYFNFLLARLCVDNTSRVVCSRIIL